MLREGFLTQWKLKYSFLILPSWNTSHALASLLLIPQKEIYWTCWIKPSVITMSIITRSKQIGLPLGFECLCYSTFRGLCIIIRCEMSWGGRKQKKIIIARGLKNHFLGQNEGQHKKCLIAHRLLMSWACFSRNKREVQLVYIMSRSGGLFLFSLFLKEGKKSSFEENFIFSVSELILEAS